MLGSADRIAEELLDSTSVKGFPIVNDENILVGYIGRTELRYILGGFHHPSFRYRGSLTNNLAYGTDKARKLQGVSSDTPCSFVPDEHEHQDVAFSGLAAGPGVSMDEDLSMEMLETTASPDVLKLWPWVNQVGSSFLWRFDSAGTCELI